MWTRSLLFMLLLLALVLPAMAQPPADSCGRDDSLDAGDSLPIDLSAILSSNDFDLTAVGCVEEGVDHVTCFTPTMGCTVTARCSDSKAVRLTDATSFGLQVAINAVEGMCTAAPTGCLDSDVGSGAGEITGLALTGGTNYCFVCESMFGIQARLEVLATTGDCGALPVDLQSLEVD